MTLKHSTLLRTLLSACAFLACTQLFAQEGNPKDKFRKTRVEIADPSAAVVRPVAAQKKSGTDLEDLHEQRQTAEGEVRYAKAKLDAAQKKLNESTASGNLEQADKLQQEAKDWEARYKSARAQLAQVEEEIGKIGGGAHGSDTEVIVPGENLEVIVVEDSSFNGRYQVRRGGYIILPQVGRIGVAGKSVDQAESAVRKELQSSQLQKATVLIERIAGSDVESGPLIYLSGEFKNPRPYRIPQGTSPTLVSVILSSGGVTDKADLTHVRVMRMAASRGVVEIVNVQQILDGKGLSSDLTLDNGDVVIIPVGASNLIYVTGNVKRQGSYHLTPGEKLTAYGAILQCGGFARFADLKKVHVLRAMPDGTKIKLPVDVKAIQKGERPDVPLQSNDIVVVPEKFFSF